MMMTKFVSLSSGHRLIYNYELTHDFLSVILFRFTPARQQMAMWCRQSLLMRNWKCDVSFFYCPSFPNLNCAGPQTLI